MSAPVEVEGDRVRAFRLLGHGLGAPVGLRVAVAACGIQEYPPGQALIALRARTLGAPDVLAAELDALRAAGEVVTVNAMRGAPYVVPRAERAIWTTALVPRDDRELRGLVGSAAATEVEEAGLSVREALDRVAAAAAHGLAAGPLGRDAFHQALRERLPDALLPWCRGCGSHHVRPALWRALGPLGVTEMPAQATWAAATPPGPGMLAPRAAGPALVRRFLRAYGPATHTALASWAGTAPAHAKALFAALADELVPVRADGARGLVLREDLPRLLDPPAARGVRLLTGYDPYVAGPGRRSLVPDDAVRKALFPPVGRPGVVLRDGRLVGLWRARKQGRSLRLAVEPLAADAAGSDVSAEAEAVARLRGCDRVTVVVG